MNLDELFSANRGNNNFTVVVRYKFTIKDIIKYLVKEGWATYGTLCFFNSSNEHPRGTSISIEYGPNYTDTELLDLIKENFVDDSMVVLAISVATYGYMKRNISISFGTKGTNETADILYLNENLKQYITRYDLFGFTGNGTLTSHIERCKWTVTIHLVGGSEIKLCNCELEVDLTAGHRGIKVRGGDVGSIANEGEDFYFIKDTTVLISSIDFFNETLKKYESYIFTSMFKSVTYDLSRYSFNIEAFFPKTSELPYIAIRYVDGKHDLFRLVEVTYKNITLETYEGMRYNFSCVEFLAGLTNDPLDQLDLRKDDQGRLIPLVDAIILLQELKPEIPDKNEDKNQEV